MAKKISRELKAIIATRKHIEKEAKDNKEYHLWSANNCPFCLEFTDNCSACPMFLIVGGCLRFVEEYFADGFNAPIEYILSFLIDLEDAYRRMEK